MSHSNPSGPLPPSVTDQIDALCDEFKLAMANDVKASLEPFLARVDSVGRSALLAKLCELTVQRLQLRGITEIDDAILEANPNVRDELNAVLKQMPPLASTEWFLSPSTNSPDLDPRPKRKQSRGLHIRCPHCSNAIELMADTSLDIVHCTSCGSNFSLIDHSEGSQPKAALKIIGRFELVSRLGVGGFGTVWKAKDTELDRLVAVKIPRGGQLNDQEIELFFREARAAAQLRHPHIVPVHEVGREDDTIFIVSDLIQGVSLANWLASQRPSIRETAALVTTIAEALDHAHEHGVVHRDLKPSNIMIDELGQPHIMDFGLAKRETEIAMTVDGQIVGTPAYMSPEQAGGNSQWVDRRSDVYSLGVILFELLTGELPFRGNAQMQIHRRLTEDAPSARSLNRHIPRDLVTICAKCLEREPTGRYETAKDVRDELQCYLNQLPIKARPLSRPARVARWMKRNPLLTTTAVLVCLLAIAGPALALREHRLRGLEAERYNIISSSQKSLAVAEKERSQLNKELSSLAGEDSPWRIWAGTKDRTPRQMLVRGFYNRSAQSLMDAIEDPSLPVSDKIRANLSLAIMEELTDQKAQAAKHFADAIVSLRETADAHPDSTISAIALAQTIDDYSRLSSVDRTQENQLLEESRTLRERLAHAAPSDLQRQIIWFESLVRSAEGLGAKQGLQWISTMQQMRNSIASKWPTDIEGIYRLTCFLADRDELLEDTSRTTPKSERPSTKDSTD